MNVFSYFYEHMNESNCQNCRCQADYKQETKTERVNLEVSICGQSSIDINVYNTEGKHIWYSGIIDINCSPEDCPFENPSDPFCYSS